MNNYKVAVVGATGLVGGKVIEVLSERHFPIRELVPVASERSVGRTIGFEGKEYKVVSLEEGVAAKPDIAIFSAGATVSKEWAPRFAKAGCRVIDNSSCWRMDKNKKLIVPEINSDALTKEDFIIANPNCSTIQMVVALAPLHRQYKIKRIVVSTYQSVTGAGQKGINQMLKERSASIGDKCEFDKVSSNGLKIANSGLKDAFASPIDLNLIPQIDVFLENGSTKEEEKMVNETHKIFNDYSIGVSATTVRVPVTGGHSESVNVEFENPFDINDVKAILADGPDPDSKAPGVVFYDDPGQCKYPMPLYCFGKDEVFVGRVRKDNSAANCLNLWVVSDNLRKGAATNTVQIAEVLVRKFLS